MNIRCLLMLTAGLFIAGNALAQDGEELATKSNCTNCHAVDARLVGPAFKKVAAKYRNDKGAQARLEKKVRNGGSGSWGSMPMPPTPSSVSNENIKSIVEWVLSLK